MSALYTWAARWRVPLEALRDLEAVMGITEDTPNVVAGAGPEATAQAEIRLAAASIPGLYLFRNNVGALQDAGGRLVRYGLANDSKRANEVMKSSDLIGIRRVVITPAMVGQAIGQFVSWETKRPGWVYSATPREVAQRRWIELVVAVGGDARFMTGAGDVS